MTRVSDLPAKICIRLGHWLNLIFFALVCLGCNTEHSRDILLDWHNGKPVFISIPFHLIQDSEEDFIPHGLQVSLQHSSEPLLGEIHMSGNHVRFTPALPFERGRAYAVHYHDKLIGEFTVPAEEKPLKTKLLEIYPQADTLPENTLKFYLSFSAPMKEGEGLQYIKLMNGENEALTDRFLDLQLELWNEDRTVLTIWLDPGRIKRDLVPNQKLGKPLSNGNRYTLLVDPGWRDARGAVLSGGFHKTFTVSGRDSTGPDPKDWSLYPPAKNTDPLRISFREPLDHYLLDQTISVIDNEKGGIAGRFTSLAEDSQLGFLPEKPWTEGRYSLRIAGILEDLAGNNLNRPFDRDITATPAKSANDFVELPFVVQFLP